MIGVGVYTTSGYTLDALGDPSLVVAAWLVGGLIAICGAVGYSSLAERFTESGGEYLFLSKTLHPVAGLMAGWVSLLAGFTGAIAIAALGFESYLRPLLNTDPLPDGSIAISSVLLVAIMHTVGVRSAARAQDFFVIVKMALIAGFVTYAIIHLSNWGDGKQDGIPTTSNIPHSLLEFAKQLVYISFSYAGFNAAIYISSEIQSPKRNVPRAMVGGTLIVTLIYIALNIIFVYAPERTVATDPNNISQIAATAADAIGGTSFAIVVRIIICLSLFTSVSAMVMTGPRVYAKMADDGFLPRTFQFRTETPVVAIWFQAVLAIAGISLTTISDLLGYLGLTLSLCSALTISMIFRLRRMDAKTKLPLFGIPAAIYVAATLFLAVLYGINDYKQGIASGITLLLGLLVYPFFQQRISSSAGRTPTVEVDNEKPKDRSDI
ncbi:MAG TPA: APC family permease [Rhodopirellula sp.]|nr:MAG: hypothetical protein CBD74_03355 [Saprospirales bacterium TMED214]HBV66009.1 APC family permease [Rhodopirellula sp.]